MVRTGERLVAPVRPQPGERRHKAFIKGLVSFGALMAGLLASSGAYAACTDPSGISSLLPFGTGGGVNALVSMIGTANTAFLTNTSAFVSAPGGVAPDTQGGGVWSRAVTGTVQTESNSTFTGNVSLNLTPLAYPPSGYSASVSGSANCHTQVTEDFSGWQVGRDISILDHDGINFHTGVTAGYIQSNGKDNGGTLRPGFEVPFAGVYAVLTSGNFYADVLGRFDYYQSVLNDPSANGIFNQRLDARGYSVTANTGYRFDLPDRWFVQPSAGITVSHVDADPFDLSGTFVSLSGVSLPGTVQINNLDSTLGRASVTIGTTVDIANGSVIAQPFFTASVFHEFAGNVTASINANSTNLGISPLLGTITTAGQLSVSRVGTYEQFGLGSNFELADTGWRAYGRVDLRTGDNLQGVTISGGLRYSFTPPGGLKDGGGLKDYGGSTDYNWTGFYAGAIAGEIDGKTNWAAPDFIKPDFAGELAGLQFGYNYQLKNTVLAGGHIVLGVEGDIGFSNARGATSCGSVIGYFVSCENDVSQLATLAGRLGYTWGQALFYVKGGLAAGDIAARAHLNAGTDTLIIGTFFDPVTTTKWEAGWTAGVGTEFALTDKWSVKGEWLHYELGQSAFAINTSGIPANISVSGETVRVGLNYHFSAGQ